MIKTDNDIVHWLDQMTDKPYYLGDPSKGWDCLNSILCLYRQFGYEFPTEIDGWTEDNYASLWEKDPVTGRKILSKLYERVGEEVQPNFYEPWDLMIFGSNKTPDIAAIYLGSGNIRMVFEDGVKDVPFHALEKHLKFVRRLRKNEIEKMGRSENDEGCRL